MLPFGTSFNLPVLILCLSGIYLLVTGYKAVLKDRQFILFAVLFFCLFIPMCVAHIDAVNPAESLRKLLSFFLYLLFGITIIRLGFKNEKSGRGFIVATGCLLLFWTVDALWQYYSGVNILGYPHTEGRLTGIFYPSFRLGIVMAILSPFYFEFIRYLQDKFRLSWILLIPFVLVIILCGSRTSWFMLLVSLIMYGVYFLAAGHQKNIRLSSVIGGLLAIAIMIIIFNIARPGHLDSITSFVTSRMASITFDAENVLSSSAVEKRIQIWESALRIISENWLNGVGIRGFRYVDQTYYTEDVDAIINQVAIFSTHPHQITLEILVETGIIGLIGFIIFWIVFIRNYFQSWSTRGGIDNLFWSIPVVIALFPLNMHKSIYGHFSSVIIWMLIAIAVANYRFTERD